MGRVSRADSLRGSGLAKLDGRSPISLVDIKRFPRRVRHELLFRYGVFCDASDLQQHG